MAPADPVDPAGPSGAARRLARSVRATDWKGRVKQAAQTLKDEYEAGKRGDDTPAQPIWASPKEQLDGVLGLLKSAAAAERTSDAARTVKAMADQVDWAKVQPVAAQVSSALIAAVASGQLGVGGRLGSTVARAIVDQGGLGQQVAKRVTAQQLAVPSDLRRIIDSTAREA